MSYNPAIPLNSDSPAVFPAQSQTNYARLQTIVGADHQFNLSAAADDGYHNLIHLTQQAPSGVLAATGRLYAKSSASRIHAFYMDDQGTEYQLTPSMPIRASVNFNGNGATSSNQTIRSSYNVSQVLQKSTAGIYEITFTNPMPDTNYIVQVTGMRPTSDDLVVGCVRGDSTYTNIVKTTKIDVAFFNNGGSNQKVLMGNVTIFSVI